MIYKCIHQLLKSDTFPDYANVLSIKLSLEERDDINNEPTKPNAYLVNQTERLFF